MSVAGSCHCGRVTLDVAHAPTEVTSCNCSICRRLGTLWAYYAPADVRVIGTTATYRWGDETLDFHHCPGCGCTTHWSPLPGRRDGQRMGINARLLDPDVLAAARVRRLDGASDPEDLFAGKRDQLAASVRPHPLADPAAWPKLLDEVEAELEELVKRETHAARSASSRTQPAHYAEDLLRIGSPSSRRCISSYWTTNVRGNVVDTPNGYCAML